MVTATSSKRFTEAYSKLNPAQKLAVDTIDGPVMVVAGPGTGKTQTIALRIAHILLSTDTAPDSILALTFTDSGARAMRERLASLIGTPAYYCHISTFHSFCSQLIHDYPDLFTFDLTQEPLSELDRLKLLYRLIDELELTVLRPIGSPYHYVQAIIRALSDLKKEGVTHAAFVTLLDQEAAFLASSQEELKKAELTRRTRDLAKNRDLALLYQAYQHELDQSHRYDYDDMIISVLGEMHHNQDFLLDLEERYQYILVDEYQDSNNSQNQLVLKLSEYWGEHANLFVTGDTDQSIMRFQGASTENQLSFIKVYPHAKIITLQENYRSPQLLLDVADSLISHNNLRISDVAPSVDTHLHSQKGVGDKLKLARLQSGTAENIFVATSIHSVIKQGVNPSSIAIIYRNNRDAQVLSETLLKYGIDYRVQKGGSILHDPTVHNLLKLFRVLSELRDRQDDTNLFTILHYPIFGIDPVDILALSRAGHDRRLNLFELLTQDELLTSLHLKSEDKLRAVLAKLMDWSKHGKTKTFTSLFEYVLSDSGYLSGVLARPDSHHSLSRLNTLFDEIKKMNRADHALSLDDFLHNLGLMEENKLKIEENPYGTNSNAVTLTTAHSAKGLEWDHVYLYRAIDGVWGNNKVRNLINLPEGILQNVNPQEIEKNEEERCLFYVALTRAKATLTITYADTYNESGRLKQAIPTMFLAEIGDASLSIVDTQSVEADAQRHVTTLLSPHEPKLEQAELELLESYVDNLELSPTSLNTYLDCAYKFKLEKLIQVPSAKKAHLAYGTAVHAALEALYHTLQTATQPDLKLVLLAFHAALDREILSAKDYALRRKRGDKALTTYYQHVQADLRPALFIERKVRAVLEAEAGAAPIILTGKIDRIEWSNEEHREVRVIDYKTGKVKKNDNIIRQLVFYKLLISLDHTLTNLTFGEAELDFVEEPAEHGKSGKRRFSVSDEQVIELQKVIQEAVSEIRALHFPRTTNYQICAKCPFIDHCYPEGLPTSQATS